MRQDLTHCEGFGTGPIPADHLDLWMAGERGLDRFGGAVWQDIEGSACLDFDQNRSILVSTSHGKVIDPQHSHIRSGRVFDGPQIAQQGWRLHLHSQSGSEALTHLSRGCEPN